MPNAKPEAADVKPQLPLSVAPTRESSPAPTKHKRKRSTTPQVVVKRESGSSAGSPPQMLEQAEAMPTLAPSLPTFPPLQIGPPPPSGQHSLPPLGRWVPPGEMPPHLESLRQSLAASRAPTFDPFAHSVLPPQTPSYRHLSPVRPSHEHEQRSLLPMPTAPMAPATGTALGATLARTPANFAHMAWPATTASPLFPVGYSLSGGIVPVAAPTASWAPPKRASAPAPALSPI